MGLSGREWSRPWPGRVLSSCLPPRQVKESSSVSIQDKKDLTEKIREIVEVLPKSNCGECGFGNCGKFAIAVAEGKAPPFGCNHDPSAGYRISEIMGVEVPEGKTQAFYPRIPSRGMGVCRGFGKGGGQGGYGRGFGRRKRRGMCG